MSEGGEGVIFDFLRGRGMDLFWNDPFHRRDRMRTQVISEEIRTSVTSLKYQTFD